MSIPIPIRASRLSVAVLTSAFVLCSPPQVQSQQVESPVMIDIGNGDGPPGRTLTLPVNIAIPEGMKITEIQMDVQFEKDVLSFTRADLAPQGTADEIKLTTTVEDDPKSAKHSILKLKAVGGKPLGSGAVADLFFRINPKAKPPGGSTGHKAAKFTTTLKKDARVTLAEGKVMTTGGRDGEIDVTAGQAIFGCFFYMH
jgi:hypothetical protein